jgi:small subunit ribosomal protein S3
MLMKNFFVDYIIKKRKIENFIRENFPNESYSRIELERTPMGVKTIIYTDNPGRIIGSGGRKINEMTEILKTKFNLENPQIDVKSIHNPDMDAQIVAKRIASALERGYNYKKIGNIMMKRVMGSGAKGVEIVIAGKLGGSKGRTGKFIEGYLKHCGDPAKKLVDHGFAEAITKPGKIGIKVKIMMSVPIISEDVPQKEKPKESHEPEKKPEKKAEAKEEKAEYREKKSEKKEGKE